MAELIEEASRMFGPAFTELVPTCRVWRNGEPASAIDPIAPGDEVALLPPVSGG